MIKAISRLFFLILLGCGLILGVVAVEYQNFLHQPLVLEHDELFQIHSGENIRSVAQRLSDLGLLEDPWLLVLLARLTGEDVRIKVGEYRIPVGATPQQLLALFVAGKSVQYSFSIIEGWSFRQLRAALRESSELQHQLDDSLSDAEVMQQLGYADQHPEGRFYPDTYHFPKDTTDIQFLQRAHQTMEQILEQEWQQKSPDLPLENAYEALILASIVEKETGVAEERPLIAAAFIERLRLNMKLQTDPTIIYGLGEEYDGDIRYRDLRRDTPYNTYIHRGLTPTPIAMPGRAAIHAVLHPADSKAIYFVSRGDGTHQFSETLEQHNAAVRRYQLKGKAPKRAADSGQ